MSEQSLPGELLRDALLPSKSIGAETRRRLSPNLYQTVSPKLVSDFEAEGWVLDRQNKASVRMRKPKAHDVAFEDRVWAAFSKLQFTSMSRDRAFRIAYGANANERKQIDVFAADDEVVLVIECKSTSNLRQHQFKDEVEAIQGTRQGVIRTIREEFPDHKIKFILATNNCILSKQTLERIKEAEIVHMDEDVIEYYLDLADHLGKAARFQLLGSLFAGTKIPGLDPRVAAIQCTMGGRKYYSFAMEPDRLLKLGYVLHRNKANTALMPTYQRLIKKTRLKRVSQFVDDGGFFPNSVIVNIDPGKRPLRFESVGKTEGPAKLGILHLPQTYRAAFIIDGQHRLYGYADSIRAESDLIPVVAFVDLARSEQVRIFMEINENQQAVPKNLRNTLNADLLWDSKDLREQSRALKLRMAQHFGEEKKSPLFGRVIIGENKRTLTRCITIDAISRGLDRGNFLGTFTKTEVRQIGTLFRGTNDGTFDFATEFVELCLWHVRFGLESQWLLGAAEGGFVFINNGVESLLRVFSDIVDHVVEAAGLDLLKMEPEELFEDCVHYLDPLIEHLATLDPEEAAEYRRQYGSGGGTKYWRRIQGAIRTARTDFDPPGLGEYLESEARAYDAESKEYVSELELFIKEDLRTRLEDEFGANWYRQGVPRKVRESAAKIAADRNLDAASDEEEVDPWDCLYLIDYARILTQEHSLWVRRFEKRYTRPGDEQRTGGWKARTSWMQQLNDIRNDLVHGRSVDADAHEFLVTLVTWLLKDQADNYL
ncbi:MAG: DGQHR domain-containing protein [Actinomycetota bacterium]